MNLKNSIKKLFSSVNLEINTAKSANFKRNAILEIDELFDLILKNYSRDKSTSQLKQDIIALIVNNFKRNGFFVEFGATDGFSLSNTYLLEKSFDWTGILCEPGKSWHSDLKNNRNCIIDNRCVHSSSGTFLEFHNSFNGELSTLKSFINSDRHNNFRKNGISYLVETVTLSELLKFHNAPAEIDFLSIDTEGSEYEILKSFDFSQYRFNFICVEHNYTNNRELIFNLLSSNGYKRILNHVSQWDDWYCKG